MDLLRRARVAQRSKTEQEDDMSEDLEAHDAVRAIISTGMLTRVGRPLFASRTMCIVCRLPAWCAGGMGLGRPEGAVRGAVDALFE